MGSETKENDRVEFESENKQFRGILWVGEHGILFARSFGFQDLDSAKRIVEIGRRFQRKLGRNPNLCLDISEMTGSAPEARAHLRENMLGDDGPMAAVAIVGGNVFLRGLYNMYARVSKSPMRVFASRELAVRWLQEI